VTKKKKGLFGGGGDDLKDTQLKSTMMLCYGYVTAYADPEYVSLPACRPLGPFEPSIASFVRLGRISCSFFFLCCC
jgi:hypothetical protein